MEFFKKIKDSIYNSDYYGQLINKPFSYSLKYYFSLILFISFLGMLIFSFTAIPSVKSFLDKAVDEVLKQYPDGLEIVIKNGKASTNVNEPYFVAMPDEWQSESLENNKENILVLDTKDLFNIENFKNYQTECLLARDSFVCYDDDATIKMMPLNQAPDFTLNKGMISSFLDKITPFFKLIYPIIVIGAWSVIFTGYVFVLLYLLFATIPIWIIARTKKIEIGYGKAYQMGMHLMTLPIIITFLFNYIIVKIIGDFSIPYFFIILLLVMAVINLKSSPVVVAPKNSEPPLPPQNPSLN